MKDKITMNAIGEMIAGDVCRPKKDKKIWDFLALLGLIVLLFELVVAVTI